MSICVTVTVPRHCSQLMTTWMMMTATCLRLCQNLVKQQSLWVNFSWFCLCFTLRNFLGVRLLNECMRLQALWISFNCMFNLSKQNWWRNWLEWNFTSTSGIVHVRLEVALVSADVCWCRSVLLLVISFDSDYSRLKPNISVYFTCLPKCILLSILLYTLFICALCL